MSADDVATLTEKLTAARENLNRLELAAGAAHTRSESATPGGLVGYDSAVLSGIRRKPNRKADARRINAYDREAAAVLALAAAEQRVRLLEKRLEVARRDEITRSAITPEALAAATHVRTELGWYEVVRVSAKSVTVRTPWSWNDRISLTKVLEVRA